MPRGGTTQDPAFDLRVLKNPGIYKYQGRQKFNSPETEVFGKNKEPHISQNGIKRFILNLISKTSAQIQEDKSFLTYYPADTELSATSLDELPKMRPVGKFEEKIGGTQQ